MVSEVVKNLLSGKNQVWMRFAEGCWRLWTLLGCIGWHVPAEWQTGVTLPPNGELQLSGYHTVWPPWESLCQGAGLQHHCSLVLWNSHMYTLHTVCFRFSLNYVCHLIIMQEILYQLIMARDKLLHSTFNFVFCRKFKFFHRSQTKVLRWKNIHFPYASNPTFHSFIVCKPGFSLTLPPQWWLLHT